MKLLFAIVAGLLAIIGNVPYLLDMFKGKVKPHPYTWFIWSIVSGVTFAGQWIGGAGWALIAFGASEIFTFIIFLFSLKYGFKNIPRQDTWFLLAALLGLIPWIITKDPTWSVIIMVTIDVIAFIPTLKKGWRHAETETPILYGSNVLRHILALFALSSYNTATMFHSIAMIVTNTAMVLGLTRKHK
jgi:hypothetical protein